MQIDRLRSKQNVLILTTSNVTSAIDAAFIDRADIKQYIGLPPAAARFQVLASCVSELARVGLLTSTPEWLPWEAAQAAWEGVQRQLEAATGRASAGAAAATAAADTTVPAWLGQLALSDVRACLTSAGEGGDDVENGSLSVLLAAVAAATDGMSGRALRKLPFLAHASHVQVVGAVSAGTMLLALLGAALAEKAARKQLAKQSSTSMQEQ